MKPVIYADTLFLFNFFMDTIIILITGKLLDLKPPIFRIGLGAAIGAAYSVLMFFPEYEVLYSLFLKIIIFLGIEYMVFGGENIKKVLKNFFVFILVNLCLGGFLMALIFLTDFGTAVGSVVSGGGVYMNLSPFILIFGILGTYFLLAIYRKMCRRRLYEKSLIKRIIIEYKGKMAEVDMFLDTGCRICDPINDNEAIIVEYDAVKLMLSDEEKALINDKKNIVRAYELGMRVLPFSTIGGDNIIYAFVADSIRGCDFLKEKIAVGIVTERKFGNEYKGLMNPELLLKEEKNLKECVL